MKLIGRPSREKLPRYVQQVKAGDKVYWYLRVPGRERAKLEIPSGCAPRSPLFLRIYADALSRSTAVLPASAIGQSRSAAGTVSAAVAAWYQATAFRGLGQRTQGSRRGSRWLPVGCYFPRPPAPRQGRALASDVEILFGVLSSRLRIAPPQRRVFEELLDRVR